jgi:amidase
MDLGFFAVDRDVVKNTHAALDRFRSLGAEVEEVKLGWTAAHLDAAMIYLKHLFGASLSPLLKKHGRDMTSYARQFAKDGQKSKAADFVASLGKVNEMYGTLGPLLERYNVLVCPTNALPAVPADFDQSKDSVTINGKRIANPFLGWVMTTPFNMLSRCPVLSVPSGFARNGVPTGIQIVGRSYCDADVFRAGIAYEEATGGWFASEAGRPRL